MAANDGLFQRYTVAQRVFLAGEKGAGRGFQLRAGDKFLWDGDVVKILPDGDIFTNSTAVQQAITDGLILADYDLSVEIGAAPSFTLDNYDRVWIINRAVGAATGVVLPASPVINQQHTIKDGKGDAAANNITISTPGLETIDGAATLVINANYGWATVAWGGVEWHQIA